MDWLALFLIDCCLTIQNICAILYMPCTKVAGEGDCCQAVDQKITKNLLEKFRPRSRQHGDRRRNYDSHDAYLPLNYTTIEYCTIG